MTRRRLPMLRPAATAAAALLLAGCMSLTPPLQRPPLPVAEVYPLLDGQRPAGSVAAAELAWQDFFADPRLRQLIGLALDSNRDLRVAALAVEQARAQLQSRRADQWPTINAAATASRSSTASSYSAGLQITAYEADFFGRVRSLGDAAEAQLQGVAEARKAVQIGLIAAIAQTHLALQADAALLEVTRRTLRTREESLQLTQLKFDHGASSELDLRQAQSLLEAARVALAQQTRQQALDQHALVLLVGRPLPAELPALRPLAEIADPLPELPAGLPSELLTRRPDIRQAEQQLIAANANIGAARAAFFPRISLTAGAGLASRELSALFSGGSFAWTLAPQLLLPIFDAGRNQANLQAATAARDIALAQYEKSIQAAFREVSDALAGQATLAEQLRAQAAQAQAEQARFRLADLRYRNGVASYLDVLDAQRAVFAAEQALVQVRAQRLQNQVLLYKVLGGGWNEAAGNAASTSAPAATASR
ncbi:efflux transporter outer membrane subunit [Piscinibacter sakaiensis]|uniref:efflux transporter outer membrane subunit n=1 Tax=Piscinibacter sakaiensis TaxID=1547922 RepID=UPI003AAE636E